MTRVTPRKLVRVVETAHGDKCLPGAPPQMPPTSPLYPIQELCRSSSGQGITAGEERHHNRLLDVARRPRHLDEWFGIHVLWAGDREDEAPVPHYIQ